MLYFLDSANIKQYFLKDPFFQIFQRSQQLSLCRVEMVKLLPVHRYSVDIFHILVLQEYWVLTENRVLGEVGGVLAKELLHLTLVLINRLNKTESTVFVYYRFSLFLKDSFFQIVLANRSASHTRFMSDFSQM